MAIPPPDPAVVARFRADLAALTGPAPARLGVAVSGGPDSLALLLLAAAAFPGQVEAATVDHGLRPESAAEATYVATICDALAIPHAILKLSWREAPTANVPAEARAARYNALCAWASKRQLPWIATAHHLDDQAETMLMRLARGSGLSGLAGVRRVTEHQGSPGGTLLRPLLGWRKAELQALVAAAGLKSVEDPTNEDERLDRTHARRLLAAAPWLEPSRLAASAAHLAESEAALGWTAERLFGERSQHLRDGAIALHASDLPRDLQRRLLLRAIVQFTDERAIPGPKLMRLLDELLAGRPATLAGVRADPGPPWMFELAPPRR